MEGDLPVSPARRWGLLSAYAVILGLLVLYIYTLYKRQRAVERDAAVLDRRIRGLSEDR